MSLIGIAGPIIGGISSGIEQGRTESHIQDRMRQYANYPDSQLNDIIRIYGGEMGEAARRVLVNRAKQNQATSTAMTAAGTQIISSNLGPILLIAGIAVVFLLFMRRK